MRIFLAPLILPFYFSTALADHEVCQGSPLQSPTWDLCTRVLLPQTDVPKDQWGSFWGDWGPRPLLYPPLKIPASCDKSDWKRQRAIGIAKTYIGLPYRHRHIPAMGGLDCSNFTSWIFNYGFGIFIDSNIERQAKSAGRKLTPSEPILPGDLLFIWSADHSRISHVALYLGGDSLIDSHGPGVQIRPYSGWYKDRFAWARRIFE